MECGYDYFIDTYYFGCESKEVRKRILESIGRTQIHDVYTCPVCTGKEPRIYKSKLGNCAKCKEEIPYTDSGDIIGNDNEGYSYYHKECSPRKKRIVNDRLVWANN